MKKLIIILLLVLAATVSYGQRRTGTFKTITVSDSILLDYLKTSNDVLLSMTSTGGIISVTTVEVTEVALPKEMTLNAQTGTTYTLVLTDATKLITLSNAAAITLTVPTNASVAFPIGTQITIVQLGAGQVTVAGAAPPNLYSADGDKKLRVQYSSATLIKIAADNWIIIGDITA